MSIIQDIKTFLTPMSTDKNEQKNNVLPTDPLGSVTPSSPEETSKTAHPTDSFSMSDFLKNIQHHLNAKPLSIENNPNLQNIKQSIEQRTHPILSDNPEERLAYAQTLSQKMLTFLHPDKK